jgi:hypothetical protein
LTGVTFALASLAGAAYVVAKLYTGRGAATPIRAAIYEQPLVALLGLVGIGFGTWMLVQPHAIVTARAWLNPRWVWRERRGEASLLALSSLAAIGMLELGSRVLYARDERVPVLFPPEYLVYPPLCHAMRDYDPDARNVLLLGGSVMNGAGRGDALERALGDPWRVYNLAQNAQCSLDALTKYRWLDGRGYQFDHVIFYEAINETRLNNAPPDVFRNDYTHYLFYRLVRAVFEDERPVWRGALHSALVFRADRLVTQLRETRALGRRFVNIAYPREDWLKYGAEIRSAAPFESNLRSIAALAERRGTEFLVFEFIYDPRIDEFVNGRPDSWPREKMVAYTKEWGLPENVQKGIEAHNAVIRKQSGDFLVISTETLRRSENFVDPCHFTPDAERKFVQLIAETLLAEEAK